MKPYYKAYDERYKTAHGKGVTWLSDKSTPIVMETIRKYNFTSTSPMLEIGCGEGRDSRAVLEKGYNLLATDVSEEAVEYCGQAMPLYRERFQIMDCLRGQDQRTYDFIYSVAVLHMLVLDQHRNGFYRFIREHLTDQGIALVCTMGNGIQEIQSDISRAFELQERAHESGRMKVAGTSCRMVSFETFEREVMINGLEIVEKGITAVVPDFDSLMFGVLRRKAGSGEFPLTTGS